MTSGRGPGALTGPDGPPLEPGRREESEEPIGPFPTWGALYATILAYGVGLILALLVLTRLLDPGTP